MDIENALKQNFIRIIDIARLAPSVHNSQPWSVSLGGNTINVKIDERYALRDGDPTGRQSIISLGIFSEAIIIASNALGFKVDMVTQRQRQVTIQFNSYSRSNAEKQSDLIDLLRKRSSDRSIYKPIRLPKGDISKIEHSSQGLHATVSVVDGEQIIEEIAHLTAKGISIALSSPGFRNELRHYLLLPWSKKKRGIAVKSLYIPRPLTYIQPQLMRIGLGTKHEAKLEKRRWQSASAVVLILSDGDLAKHWFDAGRAYLQASLIIESLGLSQATSAAIVEASDYHEDIETRLGTDQRIQAVIRIGKGSRKRHYSPRVKASEIITLN